MLKYPLDPFSLQKNVWPFVCSALLAGFGSVNDSRERLEKNVISTFVSGDGMFCLLTMLTCIVSAERIQKCRCLGLAGVALEIVI